jgi:flagellar biosynthesis protein FlhG
MAVCSGKLWSISGGKGGVGRSLLTACLGTACARLGISVAVIDANHASPDLYAILGIKAPGLTLQKALLSGKPAVEALAKTPEPNLWFASYVGDDPEKTDMNSKDHDRLIEEIHALEMDLILVDLATGSERMALNFMNWTRQAVIVSSPDPASMRCTYRLIRHAILHRLRKAFADDPKISGMLDALNPGGAGPGSITMGDFLAKLQSSDPEKHDDVVALTGSWRPHLVVNMTTSDQDRRAGEIIQSAAGKFLNIEMATVQSIPFDRNLHRSSTRILDFGETTSSPAQKQIGNLAFAIAEIACWKEQKDSSPPAPCTPVTGFNDNLVLMGRNLHIQTEDLRAAGNGITTQVFCDGRVILSTKSDCGHDPVETMETMRTQHFNVILQIENRKPKNSNSPSSNP